MRRFEYTDDKSAKFWEIAQSDTDLNIRWGRIGTAGQSQTKHFADGAKAGAAMVKLVAEKTTKGYVETAAAGTAPPAPAPSAESVDQQIDRAFAAILAQIIDAPATFADGDLSSAKIRRAHQIGEMAADQVSKHLIQAGLVSSWLSSLTVRASELARTIAAGQAGASVAVDEAPAGAAPWLAHGEPIRLGGAADNALALARATRRHPQPVDALDPQAAWDAVRPMIGDGVQPDFPNTIDAVRGAFETAWNSLGSASLSGTPQTDAMLLVLCISRDRYGHGEAGIRFIDYLVARHGLPYVIDAQLDAMQYRLHQRYVPKSHHVVSIAGRASSAAPHFHADSCWSEGQWRVRAHLAAAPQDIYDACAAKVRTAMDTLDPVCRVALALQFPDLPDMTHALIAQLSGSDAIPAVHWLQLTATDPAALAQARKIKVDEYSSLWNQLNMVSTILVEHRVDAVRWLAPGAVDHAGDALARIGTPESLDALARVASTSKAALARFGLAVERWPVAAAAAMARYLSGHPKDQSLLLPTLVELVRKDPALPALLQPWLEPAANALLETVIARLAAPSEVAAAAALPAVLARAPWLQPKKQSAGVLQLAPLPVAPVERWEDGAREALLQLGPWEIRRYQDTGRDPEIAADQLGFRLEARPDQQTAGYKAARAAACVALAQGDASALIAAWRDLLVEKKNERWYYYYLDGHAVGHLPPAVGIPFWNAAAAEANTTNADFVAATWGLSAFPGVLARIGSAPGENFGIALHFGVVELAPIAARAFARLKSLRATGRAWLKRFPEYAASALIAPALGKPGEARDCAASSLRYLAGSGQLALIEQAAARYGEPAVLPALHAMLNESPLDRYPARRAALPDFWKPDGWHRPVLHNGQALPDAALDVLGTMLAFPFNEEVYAGLYDVKAACTADSLAEFAWDCFSAWLNASAPSKDSWALAHLGLFGTDDTARKLTPFIRAWPGEAAHARAVAGLDVLAAIGSDVALMLLNGIAQKVKFKGLQDKAREKILAIAEARGLSPEELEDRLAPDLGLDDQGSMLLDFGPRAYKVGFDESLKPYVRESQDGKAGARLPDLPKPKKTDDAALAGAATERFKLLKKDARTIASQQVLRLELAMCARRRWSAAVFAQFIADHPLVRHLVRRLVWGVYTMPRETTGAGEDTETRVASYGGTLLDCFRVAEDGEYTTASDDPFILPAGEHIRIGLPHALELPASLAADFGQLLADYELLQPFPQLGRDTYALDDQERSADRLLRWKGVKVATGKILGLANIGWRRGPAQDGGGIWNYDKPADAGRALELTLDPGIIVGMVDEYPEQTLGEVLLPRRQAGGWNGNDTLSTFGTLDPIVASELIRDMERLRS